MVRTSDDARDLFTEYATAHGVTVAGLLEAIARRLPAEGAPLPAPFDGVVEEARAIDIEGRRRG